MPTGPEHVNVELVQGDTWAWVFSYTDSAGSTDLTGLTVRIDVATAYGTAGTNLFTLTDGSGLTINASAGTITLSKVVSEAVGSHVWSLYIGDRVRIRGKFTILPKVNTA